MKLEDVLPALKEGKKIRRKVWVHQVVFINIHFIGSALLSNLENLLADDWDVVEEKRELSWEDIRDAFMHNVCTITVGGEVMYQYEPESTRKKLGFTD